MGLSTLLGPGRVYIDAVILIYSVERHPDFTGLTDPLWMLARGGEIELLTSQLTILESLVRPIRDRNAKLIASFEHVFENSGLRLIPITEDVLRRAAELRASTPSLKAADSIHMATARLGGSSSFLTNDRRLASTPGLRVVQLADAFNA